MGGSYGGGGGGGSVAFADITGNPTDNTNLSTALGTKADKTASDDIVFAANKGPVVLDASAGKHRIGADTDNNPKVDTVA